MSWAIHVVTNTVRVTAKVGQDLLRAAGDSVEDLGWYSIDDDIVHGGRLIFKPDLGEHMDYVGGEKFVRDVLKKHKVDGDICFLDPYSNGQGLTMYGYRFKKGVLTHLKGSVSFRVA